MTVQEKQDFIRELIPELTKGLIPVLKDAVMEELGQMDNNGQMGQQDGQNQQKEKIDYAALVKEALK